VAQQVTRHDLEHAPSPPSDGRESLEALSFEYRKSVDARPRCSTIVGPPRLLFTSRRTCRTCRTNIKIKMRESFRPFAPIVLAERTSDYFDFSGESPYMLMVASVAEALRKPPSGRRSEDLTEWVNEVRSDIPAVTHVDYSARLQTITEENPELYAILKAFERLTGCGVLINTSFNVRGEPIVCTPEDAYRCFMRTSMDYLVLEDYILAKSDQPKFVEDEEWKTVHTLD
jgi:carbamoyltransferase